MEEVYTMNAVAVCNTNAIDGSSQVGIVKYGKGVDS